MPIKLKHVGQWIGFKGISFGILIRLNLPQSQLKLKNNINHILDFT
jgi:hypothetical protein